MTDYGTITDDELHELLNIKRTRAYIAAREMIERGFITISGRGKDKVYTISK